jgi:KaiC/GvpD/RAD55 family RecA-like ATPase
MDSLRTAHLKGIRPLDEQVTKWRSEIAQPKRRTPLGWEALDEAVRGPAPGEVFTVIAQSHVGKSMIATNVMANNPAEHIIFFSLEMPDHQVLHRLTAHVFNLNARDLETMENKRELPDLVDDLPQRLPFQVIVDDSALSLEEMSAYISDYHQFYDARPKLVIIDYLEEVGGGQGSGEGWVRAEATASAVKGWAKDEKVGVLMLHQTNRTTPVWMPPDRNSAKGAGYTQADVVIGLWRPGWDPDLPESLRHEREHWLAMNVLKNRVRGIRNEEGWLFRVDPSMSIVPVDPRQQSQLMDDYINNVVEGRF